MRSILIAINYVNYKNKKLKINQTRALNVLSSLPSYFHIISFDFLKSKKPQEFSDFPRIIYAPILKRNSSSEISNSRDLPYIKEIINKSAENKYDIVGYINSDILLGKEFVSCFHVKKDVYMFPRNEIGEVEPEDFVAGFKKIIYGGDMHAGVDGFFFDRLWWLKYKDEFPDDLILGETEWDTCYRHISKSISDNYLEKRAIYHVYHDSQWNTTSMGAQNNIAIWYNVKKRLNI